MVIVQYERTNDKGRMLTSGPIAQAIIAAVTRKFRNQEPESNIFEVLPVRAATSMEYEAGAKRAQIWNEGGNKETIDLPLEDGWRKSDGNPFGVPNGKPSTHDDPEALYLYRHQNRKFSGPVCLGVGVNGGRGFGGFGAYGGWSYGSGVALVGREATVSQNSTGTTTFRTESDLVIPARLASELRSLKPRSEEEMVNLAKALELLKSGASLEATSRVLAIVEEVLKG